MKKNFLNTAQDFYEIYTSRILPIFKYFEPERILIHKEIIKKKKSLKILIAVIITVFFLLVLFFKNLNMDAATSVGFAFLFEYFLCAIISLKQADKIQSYIERDYKKEEDFLNKLKQECLPKILKVFGDIEWLENNEDETIPEDCIKNSNTDYCYIYNKIKDEFKGTYNNVPFKISERTSEKDNDRCVFILLESNKTAKTTVLIENKKTTNRKILEIIAILCILLAFSTPFIKSFLIGFFIFIIALTTSIASHDGIALLVAMVIFGFTLIFCLVFLPIFFIIMKKSKKELTNIFDNKVKVEDINLEKKYNIICQDQVEARYLVTTAFIERFQNMKVGFKANEISCSFFEDKILICMKTKKNLFEIGDPCKSLLDFGYIKDFFNEIYSIYGIIDVLKLDEKTGI